MMTTKELQPILEAHKKYLCGEEGGVKVDLSEIDLSGADLRRANLRRADLHGADLSRADLSEANLRRADLRRADLSGANLREADLHGADLNEANLRGADLHRADLRRADLSRADLSEADLYGADIDFASISLRCEGLQWKIDRRIAAQFAYHFCSMECDDDEFIKLRNGMLDFANQFHRVDECGKLLPVIRGGITDQGTASPQEPQAGKTA
jgi:hypothetical protein